MDADQFIPDQSTTFAKSYRAIVLSCYRAIGVCIIACLMPIAGCQPDVEPIPGIPLVIAGQSYYATPGSQLLVTLEPIVYIGRDSLRRTIHVPFEWPATEDLELVDIRSSCGCLTTKVVENHEIKFSTQLSTTAGFVKKRVNVHAKLSNGIEVILVQNVVSAPPIITLKSVDSPSHARDAGSIFVDDPNAIDAIVPLVILSPSQFAVDRVESDLNTVSVEFVEHLGDYSSSKLDPAFRSLDPKFCGLKLRGSIDGDQDFTMTMIGSDRTETQITCQIKDALRMVAFPRSLQLSASDRQGSFRVCQADGRAFSIHSLVADSSKISALVALGSYKESHEISVVVPAHSTVRDSKPRRLTIATTDRSLAYPVFLVP